MDEVDAFDWLVLPIRASLIEISPEVGNQIRSDLHILLLLHDMGSQQKSNPLYVKGETVCVTRNE